LKKIIIFTGKILYFISFGLLYVCDLTNNKNNQLFNTTLQLVFIGAKLRNIQAKSALGFTETQGITHNVRHTLPDLEIEKRTVNYIT
jgi:hypothetical protein